MTRRRLNDTLDAIYLADAKLVLDKGTPKEYQYYLRDNVGNNRLVFRDSLGIPVMVNESHYYPNGGLMVGAWQQDKKTKYLYNGIERVNDFGLNVYHAKYRTLDQWTGRWWQIDPEVEQFYAWSPYNQNFGNSVRFSDPDGDCPPWICGTIAGAALDVGIQVFIEGKSFSEVNYTEVAVSAATGAIGAGLLSKASKLFKAGKGVKKATDAGKKVKKATEAGKEVGKTAKDSAKKQVKKSAKRNRVKTETPLEKAQNHLEGIEKAEAKAKKGQKQNKIRSLKKSQQNLDNALEDEIRKFNNKNRNNN